MADEIKLHKQLRKGKDAERSWNDPIWQEAFTAVDRHIMQSWKNSVGGEDQQREQAYYLHRALETLKQMVRSYIYTGDIASKQLDEIAKEKTK